MRDEPQTAATAKDDTSPHHSMYALDIATKTEKKIASDVQMDAAVTRDGIVVFGRLEGRAYYHLKGRIIYSFDPAQNKTITLTPEGKYADTFHVDAARSKVVYALDGAVYEVSASGGEPKKLGKASWSLGLTDDAVLVYSGINVYSLVPFDGRSPQVISPPSLHRILGISHGFIVSRSRWDDHYSLTPTAISDVPAMGDAGVDAGTSTESLVFSVEPDGVQLLPSGTVMYAAAKKDAETLVFEVGATDKSARLRVHGPEISGVAALTPESFAVFACQDTNDNQSCGEFDEVDVCIVERPASDVPIDLPIRKLPAELTEIVGKLAPLLEESDLKGSKVRFDRMKAGHYRCGIESPVAGPLNLEELRARIRSIQARVTELSGIPTLDVAVDYANGYRAESHYMPKQKRFVTECGIGAALVPDEKEYTLDANPTVVMGGKTSTCTGTLKNIGDTTLEGIEVSCVLGSAYSADQIVAHGKDKLTLKAGQEAKFTTEAFAHDQYSDESVRVAVRRGDEELLFGNRYARRKRTELFQAAEKLLSLAGLVYSYTSAYEGDYTVHVTMTGGFLQQSPEKRVESCTEVMKAFAKIGFQASVLPKQVSVFMYDRASKQLVFRFEEGKWEVGRKKKHAQP